MKRTNVLLFSWLAGFALTGCVSDPRIEAASSIILASPPGPIDASSPAIPAAAACHRQQATPLQQDTIEECLIKGLSYSQVAYVLGSQGEMTMEGRDTQFWIWQDEKRRVVVHFYKQKLFGAHQEEKS